MQRVKCKTKYRRQIWNPTCFSLRTFILFVLLLIAIPESCRFVVEAYVGVSFFISPCRTRLTPGFSGSSLVSLSSQSRKSYFLEQIFSRSSSDLFSNRLYATQMEEDQDDQDEQDSVLPELDMGGSGKGRGNGGHKFGGGSGNGDNDNDGDREDCDLFLGVISLLLTSRAKLLKKGKSIMDVSGRSTSTASPVLISCPNALFFKSKKRSITLTTLSAMLLLFGRSFSVVITSSKDFTRWYLKKLETDPVVTKSISAGLIGFVGDYAAQWFEYILSQKRKENLRNNSKLSKGRREGRKNNNNCQVRSLSSFWKESRLSINGNYDRRRGFALLVDGIFISGPIMHWGYDLFERLMPVQRSAGSGGGSVAAIAHVLGDCVILDSIFVATAFVMTGVLEGHSFRNDVIPQLCSEYSTIMKTSWAASLALFPFQFASFRLLPVTLRTVAVSVMDVVWDGVVSFMMHRSRR